MQFAPQANWELYESLTRDQNEAWLPGLTHDELEDALGLNLANRVRKLRLDSNSS